ncbi:hypothetical protein GOP47_0000511 [Adiantum capillus-veneris]|uniref:Uncharacterized protein n=1 Tax=Adiantum capillus-veneris TaxID=13818 RepID=A0A9D4VFA0_ADICA|nr:hypothetical protein GOP47_0000511 [Adiantum capillus-veneris]
MPASFPSSAFRPRCFFSPALRPHRLTPERGHARLQHKPPSLPVPPHLMKAHYNTCRLQGYHSWQLTFFLKHMLAGHQTAIDQI